MSGHRAGVPALLLAGALALAALVLPGAPAPRAETGPDGFYVIVARLGDASAGEHLSLRADSQALVLTARFDPHDHATERGTRVDFTGRLPVESPTQFAGTLKRFLDQ